MSKPEDPGPARQRRKRWPTAVGLLVVLVLVLVFVASRIRLPYYAISPGQASAIDPRVRTPADLPHSVHGQVLLTDVLLSQVTLLDYLPDRWSANTDVVPSSEVLGPVTAADQLAAQGYLEMSESRDAAKTAALRWLGDTVTEHDAGALVFAVQPGSPASTALRVGEVIKAVDAVPTPNSCAFVGALRGHPAGDRVVLSVEESSVTADAQIVPGKLVEKSVRLGRARTALRASGCAGPTGTSKAFLGVEVTTRQEFAFPVRVSVDTAGIGGPSAGLAMALGIIDRLAGGDLTGGRTVAATGTIDSAGNVGDVGGVAQKTVAVEGAGARAFLVPTQEYAAARRKASSSLRVYPVSTLSQALHDLERLGGRVPGPR